MKAASAVVCSLVVMLVSASGLPGADSAALMAARMALDAGHPAEAIACLQTAPEGAEKHLLSARVQLAMGHPSEALQDLGIDGPDQAVISLNHWPADLRGEAAQSAAEAALALGQPSPALVLLRDALATGGVTMEVDRCLALYLDALLQQGHAQEALQVAENLWHGWPRSRYRAHGGLVVARAIFQTQPTAAREILAAIRVDPTVPASVHLQAAEELCSILYDIHPGQCLVVAEQEIRHAQVQHGDTGTLPKLRALALSQLDPVAGAEALRALPPALAKDPVVIAAEGIAERARGVTIAMRCERALSEAAMGRGDQARRELEPLATQSDVALVTVLSIPGSDPARWVRAASASSPRGAAALAAALFASGHPDQAWEALQVAMRTALHPPDSVAALSVLYWASRCDPDQHQRVQWRSQLFAAAGARPGLEVGLAWCDEAQARVDAGLDATQAWLCAARALPGDHPYFPEACWRAAMALSAAGHDDQARALLVGDASWAGEDAAHDRCRFLLAQLEARHGDALSALQAARSLMGRGNQEQQQRLEALIHQLEVKSP